MRVFLGLASGVPGAVLPRIFCCEIAFAPRSRVSGEMTEAEMQTAVRIVKAGLADRVPIDEVQDRICRALPAITDEDLAAAFEQASYEVVAEADELRQSIEALAHRRCR